MTGENRKVPIEAGQQLLHYRLIEKIGEGGMGVVWKAADTKLDRKVAIKLLAPALRDDETARQRLLREAKSAAALDHPFICHIHESGERRGGGRSLPWSVWSVTHTSRKRSWPAGASGVA